MGSIVDMETRDDAPVHAFVLGANHLTASVALRDRLLFSEGELPEFCRALMQVPGMREAVVLSTCNRSEIYGISAQPSLSRPLIERLWGAAKGVSEDEIRNHGYFHSQGDSVRHLFRVIGSLDSMVLGEMQIFGQIKEAYRVAVDQRCVDFYLNHLFQAGIRVGKRIRSETAVHEGAVSISYAAVELAKKVLGDLKGKVVGVVGAGEMGELAAQHLHKAGAARFVFFNRTLATAEKLAADFGGELRLLSDLDKRLAQCDIVVSATGAPDIVITKAQVQEAARHRGGRPIFLIDIAAPRDIDPEAGKVSNAYLFTIDDLKNVVSENVAMRKEAARQALAIIDEEASKVDGWFKALDIVPTIRTLRDKYNVIVEKEIEKWAAGQSEETRRRLESLGRSLLNKFLHHPTTRLKLLGERGDGKRASYFAGLLFALAEEEREDGQG
ncbi:MAG TPA: glutamyl-tRNA reductase [Fibrobacteria bacterium]|nr:glutamyl-tRNA reductase [Fibrobacteria bacterium]